MRLPRTAARRLVLASATIALLGVMASAGLTAWAWVRWGPTVTYQWRTGRLTIGYKVSLAHSLKALDLPALSPITDDVKSFPSPAADADGSRKPEPLR